MNSEEVPGTLQTALSAFGTAFADGDIDTLAALLAEDVQLMWHHQDTITGRVNVVSAFGEVFDSVDTSQWKPDHHTVKVHDKAAYVLSDFTETLLPYDGRAGLRVSGRIVLFFRRDSDRWRVTRILTARSAPDEEVVG